MPSAAKICSSSAPASGSSGLISLDSRSRIVTEEPNRENTCPSSTAIGPPPMMARDAGASSVSMASRLIQYGVSASPGIGGTEALAPGLRTMPREASMVRSPTTARVGPSRWAHPG